MNIIDAMTDQNLFGGWFEGTSWAAWRVFLKSLFALPLSSAELAIFQKLTGRTAPPATPAKEGWLICGRRSGKSRIMALIGAYLAAFHNYEKYLAPGERGLVAVIAADREQAGVILRYLKAFFEVPLLKPLVARDVADGLELNNRIVIKVTTASMRLVRGYTVVAALCDEMASWRDETSAEPDKEVLAALRPGMLTIPTALLLCGSSPYARRGELFAMHQRYFGRDDNRVLVWQASTLDMNPTVDASIIEEARIADPASASSEYDATFRSDLEDFTSREAIDACTSRGVLERAPAGLKYVAWCDPSGGNSDAFTLAIAHLDKDGVAVLDAVRSRAAPFSPEAVVEEFAQLLKRYGLTKLTGDHFAGQWPVEAFRKVGITYEQSARPKRDLYLSVLPLINSMRAELLDIPKIAAEFCTLERRQSRGGREVIDHQLNGHDDLVNSISGALVLAVEKGAKNAAAMCPAVIIPPTAAVTWGPSPYDSGDNPITLDPSWPGAAPGGSAWPA